MFFRNVFKLRDVLHQKDVKIKESVLNDTKLCCFGDLYEACGLTPYINKMKKASGIKDNYHIDNIRMNQATYDTLCTLLKTNLKSKKNKWAKVYKDKKLESMFAYDTLCFGPYIDNSIKNNTICVILPGHKEFKTVNDR